MKNKLKFLIPILITLLILLIIFYIQGLYPFNDRSIVQVDADYQFIPILYRIYDFLHGNGNIIYDDIGLGNNIYISMIIQGSIFSPLSLLLYFTSRSNIVNFYNIIIIIKMCLISLTTYIYINKTFKISEFYKVIFSVLYAFSGWVMLSYFNIMWLDSVILFPLIMLFLNELLNKQKYLGYIVTLSLSLIISYYISYFILLFILFYSFFYIFLKLNKKNIKRVVYKLGLSTIIAILISSFSLVPTLYQTFISSRFNSSGSNILFYNFISKSLYLMLSTMFLVLFTKLIFKYKKDRKNIYFYLILFILFSIGIFIEPINLSIHMGSYWSFPYRYAFIPLFILMNGGLYYLENYEVIGEDKYLILKVFLFLFFCWLLIYLNNSYSSDIVNSRIILDFSDTDIYIKIVLIFCIAVILSFISLSFKNIKLKYIYFSTICMLQIFIYSGWTMYYNEGYFLTKNTNSINNNLNIVNNSLGRYKMGYNNYTPNYGFIYNVNTIDNWLHILPSNQIDIYERLGYKVTNTRVSSLGGTIFTDWLFNVKYLLDDEYKNDEIYELIDQYNGYYLYEYKYNNGFGVLYNNINNFNYDSLYSFDMQNAIYRDLIDKDNDVIEVGYYKYSDIDSIKLNYGISDKGFLYLNLFNDVSYVKVNDNYINFDGYNYIIDLGIYEEDIIIEIGVKNDINYVNFSLGFIKYNDIMNLSNNIHKVDKINNGYDITIYNNLDNGYLFLPINNISGLEVKVNDKIINNESYVDNFLSIKLDKGDNKIEIRYKMPLFRLSVLLSIVGFIFLLFFNKLPINKIVLNVTYYSFILLCLLLYLYYYLFSFFKYYKF